MKLKISMILVFLLSLAILFAMVSSAGAQEGDILENNFGFVPNSWDASVSKVDLLNFEEVARYYTAPRDGVDVRSWRTNRIAMDAEGNAWVLNTGTDAFEYGPSEGLQGQVIRIQGDTEGLANTHAYPDPVLDFDTDDAVQVFNVSEINDMPRAIAVDSDGYIWVGFYGSGELHKYEYTENGNLENVWIFSPEDSTIRFYEIKFAPNGNLFISSRSSTPSVSGDFGIWTFNESESNFSRETTFNPYSILIADDGTVYATAYSNSLHIRDKDTKEWSSVVVGGPQNRGIAFDDFGKIWISSTTFQSQIFGGTVVYSYNISDGTVGPTYNLLDGTVPVGIGKDPNGVMWVICRSDSLDQGYIEGFNPVTQEQIAAVQVGPRPYAYGDFTQTVLQEKLTVTKTAETSYNRTHFWDISKSVKTENNHTVEDDIAKIWLFTDGSGDETATWFVNVSYEGFNDSDFTVCGEITINNTGTLPANITSVMDKLAGSEINVNWVNETGGIVVFPYILEVGENLTGTYCVGVDDYLVGFNNISVTTERDFTYNASAPIIWGEEPDNELYNEVNITDTSDLFGKVDIGTVNAPESEVFTYDNYFAWVNYTNREENDNRKDGSYTYENTATIVETNQSADAILKVNVLGCLNITKEWILPGIELPDNITILIEGPSFEDGSKEIVLKADEGWSYEICDLIPGIYTISELVDTDKWSATYIVNGMVSNDVGVVEVEAGQISELTIRNAGILIGTETFWAILDTSNSGAEVAGVIYHNNNVDGNPSNAWGWTNFINESGIYVFELWAGAGQNDLNNGVYVGTLIVDVNEESDTTFNATVNYHLNPGYVLEESHLWVGETKLPVVQRGRNTFFTAAPGQFPYSDGVTVSGLSEDGFYVAAHGVVTSTP